MTKPLDRPWDVIRTEYTCGTDSLSFLARKYDVQESTMAQRSAREGWAKERKLIQARAVAEAAAEVQRTMSLEIAATHILDLTIANGLKRQIKRDLDLLVEEQQGKMKHPAMEASKIRSLAAAAEHAQRVAQIAIGQATEINETNLQVQAEAPNLEELSEEEIRALITAREIVDKVSKIPVAGSDAAS